MINKLENKVYPGRGIICGLTPNAKEAVQIYWAMGRSENSKKRIFVNENGIVKTFPTTDDILIRPELVIYNLAVESNKNYVVSNGNQTDAFLEDLNKGLSFSESLEKWNFEHDDPIFTPRITAISKIDNETCSYKIGIVKTYMNDSKYCFRQVFDYDKAVPGIGHCIHTYADNGNPCPPFEGEPFCVSLDDDINKNIDNYWNALCADYRVGIMAKHIDIETGKSKILIKNAIEKNID